MMEIVLILRVGENGERGVALVFEASEAPVFNQYGVSILGSTVRSLVIKIKPRQYFVPYDNISSLSFDEVELA